MIENPSSTKQLNKFGIKDETALSTAAKDPSAKQYEVVRVPWPYANALMEASDRIRKVQSEAEWWGAWRDTFGILVFAGRRGRVTVEDWMDGAYGCGGWWRSEYTLPKIRFYLGSVFRRSHTTWKV